MLTTLRGWFQRDRDQSPPPPELANYLAAAKPAGSAPWRDIGYTALDLETSDVHPARGAILAIGLVDIDQGRIRLQSAWRQLVKPPADRAPTLDTIRVHGLTPGSLDQAPTLDDVVPELIDRLTGRVLVCYVVPVDVGFLNQAFERRWRRRLANSVIDVAGLDRTCAGLRRYIDTGAMHHPAPNLTALARELRIPVHRQHDALGDALTTAQVFLALANELEEFGKRRYADLARAGR